MRLFLSMCLMVASVSLFAEKMILEAEQFISPENTLVKRKELSGAAGVKMTDGKILTRQEMRSPHKPSLQLKYRIPDKGNYTIRFYVFAPDNGSDSFYFSVDGGRLYTFTAKKKGEIFTLSRKFSFSQGDHTLEVYPRENNLIIDKVEISKVTHGRRKRKLVVPNWPKPPFYPPKKHPRVLVNNKYLEHIKELIQTNPDFMSAYKQLKKAADRPHAGELPKSKNASGSVLSGIQAQAFIYLLDKNNEAGQNAINNIKTFLNEAKYRNQHDICRLFGQAIYAAGTVYDWCYPLLKDSDKQEIYKGIMKLAPQMEIAWPPVLQSSITGHAGEAQLFRDLLAAGIAVFDEYPQMYDLCARRFFAEMQQPREFFYQSHRHHQGTSYGPYRFSWEVWGAMMFYRMNGKLVYSNNMTKVPYSWIYERLPNGQLMRDGDVFHSGSLWVMPDRMLLLLSLYQDQYIAREFELQGGKLMKRTAPLNYLLFAPPEVKPAEFNTLPLTKYFPGPLAAMTARTGWNMGIDSNAAVVYMKGAGYHFNNHQHLDAGTFQIYYRGALAVDSGAYGGLKYGSPYDWSYNKRTISHNGMLFFDPNGKSFRGDYDGGQKYSNRGKEPRNLKELKEKDYRNGYVLAHDFGPSKSRPFYSYMKVDLQPAYDSTVQSYQRVFCFLNFDNPERPGALIVLDKTVTNKPGIQKIWLLHSVQEPTITTNKITVVRDKDGYSGKLVDNVLLPKTGDVKIEKLGPPKYINHIFGRNYPIVRNNDQSSSWRAQISPVKQKNADTFLNVLQLMKDNKKELSAKLIETDTILGVEINGRVVLFSRDEKRLKKRFTFKIEGKNSQVLLTDLQTGNWEIADEKSGRKVSVHAVTKDAGTLFCILPAGSYTAGLTFEKGAAEQADYIKLMPKKEEKLSTRAVINGKVIPLNNVINQSGKTFIPAKPVLIAAGAQVHTDGTSLSAEMSQRQLKVIAGKGSVKRVDSQIYLPLNRIANFLRQKARYEGFSNLVIFSEMPAERFNYPWYVNISTNKNNPGHPAADSCDGNQKTYWAGRGNNSIITYTLEKSMKVNGMRIFWYGGNSRQAFFKISVSKDGKHWKTVFDGESSGHSTGFETYSFPVEEARFVRITGKGNSSNDYTSIREAAVMVAK